MRSRAPTAVIVAFMATALYTGFAGRDIYPFSTFPMYRSARPDPYRAEYYELVGITRHDRVTRDVIAPLGTSLILHWVHDSQGDPQRLRVIANMLLDYNRHRRPGLELEAIRITKATYEFPVYPSRARPRKADVEVVYETGR